jgi:arylsulfatase A-like enzyme
MNSVDRVVGQIVQQLERLDLADHTIFIYSSDNGILHGEHGYGGKCLLYEPSIRVPLTIHDPRLPAEKRGRRVRELVMSQDVAPTILDLCGITTPAPCRDAVWVRSCAASRSRGGATSSARA